MSRKQIIVLKLQLPQQSLKQGRTCSASFSGLNNLLVAQFQLQKQLLNHMNSVAENAMQG